MDNMPPHHTASSPIILFVKSGRIHFFDLFIVEDGLDCRVKLWVVHGLYDQAVALVAGTGL